MQEEAPDATNWRKIVAIVQAVLCDGTLAKYSMCQKVVLILKGDGRDFWGVGLV